MDYNDLVDRVAQQDGQWSPKAGYEGGKRTRATRLWNPRNRPADVERRDDAEMLTARARWLGRNNPLCINARDCYVNNVIGEMIRTKSQIRTADGELMADMNKQSDEVYKKWMDQADVRGRAHWAEMARTNLHETIESGNGFLIETSIDDPTRILPIAFESVEYDQLDRTKDRPPGKDVNEIRNGIEFDARGRRVFYHFYTQHPQGTWTTFAQDSERIPASRVIHLFKAKRPTQTIGVSWFAPIVKQLWDFYEYQTHEINAAKVASYFVYMLKREEQGELGIPDEDGETTPTDDATDAPEVPIGPGIALTGSPRDSLEVIQSNRATAPDAWLKLMMQTMGAGLGLSYQRFTGDFSQTNFSSSRAADLQDRKGFLPLQNWHQWYVDLEVRKRVMRQAFAFGLIQVPSGGLARFNRNPERWIACKGIPPGWGYVDPGKQVAASIAAIGSGLSTFERELGAIGLDFEEVLPTLANEIKRFGELGVPLANVFPQAPKPAARPADDREEQDNEDQKRQEQDEDDE